MMPPRVAPSPTRKFPASSVRSGSWTPSSSRTHGARDDLDEAIGFIAEEAPEVARTVLDRILTAAQSLGELSERGRILPELQDPTIRELLEDPFRLVYHVTDEAVEILGLLHQRRDFKLWDRTLPT